MSEPAQRAICSPSRSGSSLSQPSDTITTTAPLARPRRPKRSLNSPIASPIRVPPDQSSTWPTAVARARARGRSCRSDRVSWVSCVENTNVSARKRPDGAVEQVEVGPGVGLHRARYVSDQDDPTPTFGHPSTAECGREATRAVGPTHRGAPIDRVAGSMTAPAPAGSLRRDHFESGDDPAQLDQLLERAVGEIPSPQQLLCAGGGPGGGVASAGRRRSRVGHYRRRPVRVAVRRPFRVLLDSLHDQRWLRPRSNESISGWFGSPRASATSLTPRNTSANTRSYGGDLGGRGGERDPSQPVQLLGRHRSDELRARLRTARPGPGRQRRRRCGGGWRAAPRSPPDQASVPTSQDKRTVGDQFGVLAILQDRADRDRRRLLAEHVEAEQAERLHPADRLGDPRCFLHLQRADAGHGVGDVLGQ